MDYSILDDQALIRLIHHARPEALAALYDRYGRLVFGIALHAVGDRETAEEITQDVFTRVWQKAGTYQAEQARVVTWLASITRYRSIDLLRQRGSRREASSLSWEEVGPVSEPRVEGPEGEAELALEQARVRTALAGLPREQRQALDLAYFQGLTHQEIAERLGEPLGTVKTRIRLAMQKLRERLGSPLGVEE